LTSLNVLLPIRNPNMAWLRETLASLAEQELRDFHLVAVLHPDDRSVDKVIRSYGLSTEVTLAHRHGNLSDALNSGLELCTADLTARIDQDDRAHPKRFTLQCQALFEDLDCVAIGSGARLIDHNGTYIGSRRMPSTFRSSLNRMRWKSALMHPTVMFRTRIVKEIGGYSSVAQNVEDYELWLRILRFGQIRSLPQELLDYRLHPEQMTQLRRINREAIKSVSIARRNLAGTRDESPLMADVRQFVWSSRQILRARSRGSD